MEQIIFEVTILLVVMVINLVALLVGSGCYQVLKRRCLGGGQPYLGSAVGRIGDGAIINGMGELIQKVISKLQGGQEQNYLIL